MDRKSSQVSRAAAPNQGEQEAPWAAWAQILKDFLPGFRDGRADAWARVLFAEPAAPFRGLARYTDRELEFACGLIARDLGAGEFAALRTIIETLREVRKKRIEDDQRRHQDFSRKALPERAPPHPDDVARMREAAELARKEFREKAARIGARGSAKGTDAFDLGRPRDATPEEARRAEEVRARLREQAAMLKEGLTDEY